MTDYTPRQGPGAARDATQLFATFLMLNDNYLPGALVLADSLRLQGAEQPLVCLTTDGVSDAAEQALRSVFDDVIRVERVYIPHSRRQERQDRPYYFTRIQVLRLGQDGDLGYRCERVVVIDADVLTLAKYASLFQIEAPAGILNERKENFVETDSSGGYVVTPTAWKTGEWRWHDLYRMCPHGHPIPRDLTDRVATDPTNMGINGSLFVMRPDRDEFDGILEDVKRPEIAARVGDAFDWPDMQYLTMRWSGQWRSVDVRFSALNGYPDLSLIWGTHFAGFKPWYFQRERAMRRYLRFPDFQLWFARYQQMVQRHPQLLEMGKLRRLNDAISQTLDGTGR
ncbi:MAG: hypothetical protein CME24_16640 [Gemmatimonadetes bacterium]|nr:hypothetical protein [Gemmatimonadota bacterium]